MIQPTISITEPKYNHILAALPEPEWLRWQTDLELFICR